MGNFLCYNNMFISLRHDPVPYDLYRMQAVSGCFDERSCHGVCPCRTSKSAPLKSWDLLCCG